VFSPPPWHPLPRNCSASKLDQIIIGRKETRRRKNCACSASRRIVAGRRTVQNDGRGRTQPAARPRLVFLPSSWDTTNTATEQQQKPQRKTFSRSALLGSILWQKKSSPAHFGPAWWARNSKRSQRGCRVKVESGAARFHLLHPPAHDVRTATFTPTPTYY